MKENSYHRRIFGFQQVISLLQRVLVEEYYYFHHNQEVDEESRRSPIIISIEEIQRNLLFLLQEIVYQILDYKFPLEMYTDYE